MIDLPKRKDLRLRDWNYSTPGAYFITICTQEKRCILSEILPVGAGVLDRPNLKLTEMGKQVEEILLEMNKKTSGIDVNQYVIMPNHVHFLLTVTNDGASRTPPPTGANAEIPRFVSTFKRFTNKACGQSLWQRSYHDHVIRNEQDYSDIAEYIENNPAKWSEDCYAK